jgi:Fe-S cluster assembly protein SufD
VNTKPQLEIFADDVSCTHGATIGQLEEDQKFYLRSRGIPEDEAEQLLVYAFAAEIIETIDVEAVRDRLTNAIARQADVSFE